MPDFITIKEVNANTDKVGNKVIADMSQMQQSIINSILGTDGRSLSESFLRYGEFKAIASDTVQKTIIDENWKSFAMREKTSSEEMNTPRTIQIGSFTTIVPGTLEINFEGYTEGSNVSYKIGLYSEGAQVASFSHSTLSNKPDKPTKVTNTFNLVPGKYSMCLSYNLNYNTMYLLLKNVTVCCDFEPIIRNQIL